MLRVFLSLVILCLFCLQSDAAPRAAKNACANGKCVQTAEPPVACPCGTACACASGCPASCGKAKQRVRHVVFRGFFRRCR